MLSSTNFCRDWRCSDSRRCSCFWGQDPSSPCLPLTPVWVEEEQQGLNRHAEPLGRRVMVNGARKEWCRQMGWKVMMWVPACAPVGPCSLGTARSHPACCRRAEELWLWGKPHASQKYAFGSVPGILASANLNNAWYRPTKGFPGNPFQSRPGFCKPRWGLRRALVAVGVGWQKAGC